MPDLLTVYLISLIVSVLMLAWYLRPKPKGRGDACRSPNREGR